jgi:hypothetical protein
MRSTRIDERCGCGLVLVSSAQRFGCLDCGLACCAACAVTLESVAYCRGCATRLLGTASPAVRGTPELL